MNNVCTMVNNAIDNTRALYMGLPAPIRAAMKRAAEVEAWTTDTWLLETRLAADVLATGGDAADHLARLYGNAAGGQETLI